MVVVRLAPPLLLVAGVVVVLVRLGLMEAQATAVLVVVAQFLLYQAHL
jgi:hypothetical protein